MGNSRDLSASNKVFKQYVVNIYNKSNSILTAAEEAVRQLRKCNDTAKLSNSLGVA